MIKLLIDTSNNKKLLVELEVNNKKDKIFLESELVKSEEAIPSIQELLKRNNLTIQDVEKVEVNEGPGSFTGIRVGISIANALGAFLNIPVNGKKIGELAKPVYNK